MQPKKPIQNVDDPGEAHSQHGFTNKLEAKIAKLEEANRELQHQIAARQKIQADQERLIATLQKELSEAKTLAGYIPICASCKKIRDDQGFWTQLELYLMSHSKAKFTHSFCPDCARQYLPDLRKEESGST